MAFLVPAASASVPTERGKTVSAYNNYFSPKAVTVSRGTKVTWVIRQGVHNVKGKGLSSPILSRGQTFSKRFKRNGTYRYVCTLHSGMAGKVTVR